MKFKVRSEIKKDLRQVLVLAQIPHKFTSDSLEAPITEEMFDRYVNRAKCEKKSRETGFLYVTQQEADDGGFLTYLLHTRKETAYHIIDHES